MRTVSIKIYDGNGDSEVHELDNDITTIEQAKTLIRSKGHNPNDMMIMVHDENGDMIESA